MTITEGLLEAAFSVGFSPKVYNKDTIRTAVSDLLKIGGWCEMAASLGPSQLRVGS
jgi:hypothetical protein